MNVAAEDIHWMRQALTLARHGRGWVEPNPLVGCVLVRDGKLLSQGFHQRYGQAHAEANALAQLPDGGARGASAYVTLEPCCHEKKQTPPCAPRLIAAQVARVVIGCLDPNPLVNGRGVAMLREAKIACVVGVLENDCRQLNAPFFSLTLRNQPYVTLKWAQSADGKLGLPGPRPLAISGPQSLAAMHQLRGRCDAILIGIGTALSDDPLLTARPAAGAAATGEAPRQPLRVVLDRWLRLPLESRLVQSAAQIPLRLYCAAEALEKQAPKAQRLQAAGVQLQPAKLCRQGICLQSVLLDLGTEKRTHVLIEPGPTLGRHIIEAQLADRLWRFTAPLQVQPPDADAAATPDAAAAPAAPAAPAVDWPVVAEMSLGADRLTEALNPQSPSFYAYQPSADWPQEPRT